MSGDQTFCMGAKGPDPYCSTHCRPGHKHSQCGCPCDHRDPQAALDELRYGLRLVLEEYVDPASEDPEDWECEPEDRWRMVRDLRGLLGMGTTAREEES